ncbi:MAG: CBS domain-containing protein [Planctomycetota bacterium]|jgi:CBS domain-containing protein
MPVVETDIQSQVLQLVPKAFDGFCEDISALFNIDMVCEQKEVHTTTIQELQNHFDNFIAVNTVSAEGAITGDFLFVVGHKGLFTLPGIISMTPEEEIIENIEQASDKKAQSMTEALNECANLFVGSWDRIFRENLTGHDHLVQSRSFIGMPSNQPEKAFGFSLERQIIFISYEMTIGSYPSFKCGVIFPKDVFSIDPEKTEDDEQTQQQPVDIEPKNKDSKIHQKQNVKHPLSDAFSDLSNESQSVSAEDIMQKNVIWISPDDTVETAISKMEEHDAGYLMVGSEDVEKGTMLEGIVSRSDIAGAVSPYLRSTFAKWRRPIDDATLQIRIKWIMSKPVRTVKLDAPISVIMENMNRYGGRCLPVADDQGKVVGLVTVFDIFDSLLTDSGISIIGKVGHPPLFV